MEKFGSFVAIVGFVLGAFLTLGFLGFKSDKDKPYGCIQNFEEVVCMAIRPKLPKPPSYNGFFKRNSNFLSKKEVNIIYNEQRLFDFIDNWMKFIIKTLPKDNYWEKEMGFVSDTDIFDNNSVNRVHQFNNMKDHFGVSSEIPYIIEKYYVSTFIVYKK